MNPNARDAAVPIFAPIQNMVFAALDDTLYWKKEKKKKALQCGIRFYLAYALITNINVD